MPKFDFLILYPPLENSTTRITIPCSKASILIYANVPYASQWGEINPEVIFLVLRRVTNKKFTKFHIFSLMRL